MDHNLNVKCKAIKLSEENMRENFHVLDMILKEEKLTN